MQGYFQICVSVPLKHLQNSLEAYMLEGPLLNKVADQ